MWRPSGIFNKSYEEDRAVIRTRVQWTALILFLLAITFFPFFFGNKYILSIIILTIITVITLQGLNFILGFTGQISVGHSAFMAIGAYATTILMTRLHFPFILSFPCAGLCAALVGMIFGLPSLRIKGFYLSSGHLGCPIPHQLVPPPRREFYRTPLRSLCSPCWYWKFCPGIRSYLLSICYVHVASDVLFCKKYRKKQNRPGLYRGQGQ